MVGKVQAQVQVDARDRALAGWYMKIMFKPQYASRRA
jgi:hypothetical protein